MFILGSLIAIGAALVFAAVAGLLAWGGTIALRREVLRGFVSVPPSASERLLTLAFVVVPLFGAALLSLLAAWRILLVAFGMGG
jgi:hypothetical protein